MSVVHEGGAVPLYRRSAALPEALAAQTLRAAQDAAAWRLVDRMLAMSLGWWLVMLGMQYLGAFQGVGLLVGAIGPIAATWLWKRYTREDSQWQDEYWGGCHRCGVAFNGGETDSLRCPTCGERWRLRLPPRTGTHPRGGATLMIWVVGLVFAAIAFAVAGLLGASFDDALNYGAISVYAGALAGLSLHGRRLLARDAPWIFD